MNISAQFLRPSALLFGGLLVPVLLIAGCGGGGGGSNGGPSLPTPAPVGTPGATVTPGPTFTPGPTPTPGPTATPTPVQLQIPTFAFVSTRNGNPEIYIARSNAQSQTRITNDPAPDSSPSLSPNGRAVVYSSTRNGNPEIYFQAIDGTDPTPIRYTADTGLFPPSDTDPTFSPDGNTIAWVSTRGGKSNIWLMDATGNNQRQLTNVAGDTTAAFAPAWSPNGSRIAYFVTRLTNTNLQFIGVNPDGTPGAVTVTNLSSAAPKSSPSFSPDGTRLVFEQSFPRLGTSNLSIYNIAAGTETPGPGAGRNSGDPTWSRTGNVIVYSASGGTTTNRQLFASVPGSGQNRQITTAGENFEPEF